MIDYKKLFYLILELFAVIGYIWCFVFVINLEIPSEFYSVESIKKLQLFKVLFASIFALVAIKLIPVDFNIIKNKKPKS